MEFPEAFWEGSVDYFGAAVPGGPAARGRCFMFWNLQRFAQKPILTAVVAGEAAEVHILDTAAELSCTQVFSYVLAYANSSEESSGVTNVGVGRADLLHLFVSDAGACFICISRGKGICLR